MKAKRILVVDDEPGLRDILCFYLEDAGYEVLIAGGGLEAIEVINSQAVDAVVSDIRMPLGSGIDLLNAIQSTRAPKPVVLLVTAFSDITIEDAYEKGAEAVLSKPVKPENLVMALQRTFASKDDRWRRQASRLIAPLGVELRTKTLSTVFTSQTFNIGRGGVFIELASDDLPTVGTVLEFRLEQPKGCSVYIEGEGLVRWTRDESAGALSPRGFGLEFTYLSDESRSGMASLINDIKVGAFIPKGIVGR